MELRVSDLFKLVIFFCISICSWGMLLPATIVVLSAKGFSNTSVGIFASLPFFAMMFTAIFLNKIRSKIGIKKCYLLAITLITISHLGFAYTFNFYLWCFYNLVSGFSGAILWVVGESFIAEKAPAKSKGKYIGIFEAMQGAAYASGPILAKIFNLSGQYAIDVSLVLRIISFISLVLIFINFDVTSTARVSDKKEKIVNKSLLNRYNYLIFAAFLAGLYESGSGAVASIYSISLEFTETTAILAPGIIGFGSLLMQYPLGHISDKIPTVKILNYCFILLSIACFGLFFTHEIKWLIWIILFIWGAFGGGLYTIAIVEVGKRVKSANILSATAYVVIFYNIGAIIGPFIGGIALDISKYYGIALFYSLTTIMIYSVFWKLSKKI